MDNQSDVVEWRTVDEYVADRPRIFRSRESWRWFERSNAAALLEAGAIACPTGTKLINPTACDKVVLIVGLSRAAQLTRRGA